MTEMDLESQLGQLLGGGRGGKAGELLGSLLRTIGADGAGNPLSGLLQQLHDGGLGDKAGSWVSTRPNEPVTGVELAQALPYQALEHVAEHCGVSAEEAADGLAAVLPEAVDRLTPGGEVPQVSLADLVGRLQKG